MILSIQSHLFTKFVNQRMIFIFKKKLIYHQCETEIKPGEFVAVLANAPAKEYVSSTKAILYKWIEQTDGSVYCEKCFDKSYSVT